jgi:hypothetical protein
LVSLIILGRECVPSAILEKMKEIGFDTIGLDRERIASKLQRWREQTQGSEGVGRKRKIQRKKVIYPGSFKWKV